jgi:hypothetical protein
MTRQELLDAGFREHPSNGDSVLQRWDVLYQKRIRDENGTRYFIDVMFWRHSKCGDYLDGWSVEINYNDGCAFSPIQGIKVEASVRTETAAEVEAFAAELWQRLCPNYYERGQ